MDSAALSAREEVAWRSGKRPRAEAGCTPVMDSGARRRPFEEVKWALLTKEQEMERRHVQEVRVATGHSVVRTSGRCSRWERGR